MSRPPQTIIDRPAQPGFRERFGDDQVEAGRVEAAKGGEEIRRRLAQIAVMR